MDGTQTRSGCSGEEKSILLPRIEPQFVGGPDRSQSLYRLSCLGHVIPHYAVIRITLLMCNLTSWEFSYTQESSKI
jgi:hypothetical protein